MTHLRAALGIGAHIWTTDTTALLAIDHLPVSIHEVRGEVEEILNEAVPNRIVLLQLHKVTLLKVTFNIEVSFAHDGKRDIASHLGEGQVEVGLVDVVC